MTGWVMRGIQSFLEVSWVINASIVGGWMILAVLMLRLLLKKVPKRLTLALWGLVALRLLVPVCLESPFSLIPSAQTIPQALLQAQGIKLHEGAQLELITNPIYGQGFSVQLPKTIDQVSIRLPYFTLHWLAGMGAMLLYALVEWCRMKYKTATAVWLRDNVFQSENVTMPFVLGLVRPRIYLPFGLEQGHICHIVAHEQAHIRRRDHWWKMLGFVLLSIYWFHPLMWLAYGLFCRDLELCCDEAVIRKLDASGRAEYAQALVASSLGTSWRSRFPLAFGEVGVKARVKAVLRYKKPGKRLVAAGVLVCLLTGVCFLTNPPSLPQPQWGLRLGAQDVTSTGLTLVFHNENGGLFTGNPYSLEKWEHGRWEAVEGATSIFTMERWQIPQGDSARGISWGDSLEPGRYRIGKSVQWKRGFGTDADAVFYAEFTLENTD